MRCMVAVLVHVDRFQCRIDTAADFCGLNTEVFRAECHVFLNNTRDKLVIRVLLHKAHAAAHVKLRFLHGGIDAVHRHGAGGRHQHTVKQLRHGGFTAAVVAEQRHKRTFFNVEIDAVQGLAALFAV